MQEFDNLTEQEKESVLEKAMAWYTEHENHVDQMLELLGVRTKGIRPSGSDMFRPELWKDIHWKWFFLGDQR